MGSEKTCELVRLAQMDMDLGRKIIGFKPKKDDRSVNGLGADRSFIASRIGISIPADLVDAEEMIKYIDNHPEIKTVAISEIHLFGAKGEMLIDLVKRYEKNQDRKLILDGLIRDFRGEAFPFGDSGRYVSDVMPFSRNIEKEGKCFYWPQSGGEACGQPAYFTQRLFDGFPAPRDSPLLEVGGDRGRVVEYKGRKVIVTYKGVCQDHHFIGGERELEEIVNNKKFHFPQPIESLERPADSGLKSIYHGGSAVT